jgi:DNA-binding transcriptional ArsR family regulator
MTAKLDVERLEKAAEMLKSIAHPMRIAILNLIDQNERMSVTEIFEGVGINQAVASQHLRILKDRGILESKREGRQIYYSIRHEILGQILSCIEKCEF